MVSSQRPLEQESCGRADREQHLISTDTGFPAFFGKGARGEPLKVDHASGVNGQRRCWVVHPCELDAQDVTRPPQR